MSKPTSEAHRRASKKYYEKNRDVKKVQMIEYYEQNAEHFKAKRRARYAAKKLELAESAKNLVSILPVEV
jgi:hypothetical protein